MGLSSPSDSKGPLGGLHWQQVWQAHVFGHDPLLWPLHVLYKAISSGLRDSPKHNVLLQPLHGML